MWRQRGSPSGPSAWRAAERGAAGPPTDLADWLASGLAWTLLLLLLLELALAILSDLLGRLVSLVEPLLAERFANTASARLMAHTATLDFEELDDSGVQDRLDRGRRQAELEVLERYAERFDFQAARIAQDYAALVPLPFARPSAPRSRRG